MNEDEQQKGIYVGEWNTSVPNKIMKNPDLSIKARFFWALLKSFMSPKKQTAYPSIQYLSKVADCTTDTVTKYLRELEDANLLYRSKKVGEKTYYILAPKPMDSKQLKENDADLREAIFQTGCNVEQLRHLNNKIYGDKNG